MWPFRPRTIAEEVSRRGISLLLHSTHLYKNLPQILETGWILTARELRVRHGDNASRYLHDPLRYEQFSVGLDYLNCSLSLPNAPLLYHRSKSNWQSEWIHFSLDLSLLSKEDTSFCPVSAAADKGTHVVSGLDGFRAMFAETVADRSREGLNKDLPTHPQAEVLIHGSVSLSLVHSVIVSQEGAAAEVTRLSERFDRPLFVQTLPQLFVWPERLMKG
jgi:hypothetical protein